MSALVPPWPLAVLGLALGWLDTGQQMDALHAQEQAMRASEAPGAAVLAAHAAADRAPLQRTRDHWQQALAAACTDAAQMHAVLAYTITHTEIVRAALSGTPPDAWPPRPEETLPHAF